MSVDLAASNLVRTSRWPVRVRLPSERRSLSRSAARALDVFEYFGRVRRPLRAVEIATALGLQSSTANQLLKTLVESAHLVFDARNKTYLPSPRLMEFSRWLVASYDERLRGLVLAVHSATGRFVSLASPNGLYMQVLDFAGHEPGIQHAERGLNISIFGTAIGSAYLSTLEAGEIAQLADRARVPPAEMPQIFDSIARIRERGFADGPSADGGFWSIAAPLPHQPLGVPLVMGVGGAPELVQERCEALYGQIRDVMARWIAESRRGDPQP